LPRKGAGSESEPEPTVVQRGRAALKLRKNTCESAQTRGDFKSGGEGKKEERGTGAVVKPGGPGRREGSQQKQKPGNTNRRLRGRDGGGEMKGMKEIRTLSSCIKRWGGEKGGIHTKSATVEKSPDKQKGKKRIFRPGKRCSQTEDRENHKWRTPIRSAGIRIKHPEQGLNE